MSGCVFAPYSQLGFITQSSPLNSFRGNMAARVVRGGRKRGTVSGQAFRPQPRAELGLALANTEMTFL